MATIRTTDRESLWHAYPTLVESHEQSAHDYDG